MILVVGGVPLIYDIAQVGRSELRHKRRIVDDIRQEVKSSEKSRGHDGETTEKEPDTREDGRPAVKSAENASERGGESAQQSDKTFRIDIDEGGKWDVEAAERAPGQGGEAPENPGLAPETDPSSEVLQRAQRSLEDAREDAEGEWRRAVWWALVAPLTGALLVFGAAVLLWIAIGVRNDQPSNEEAAGQEQASTTTSASIRTPQEPARADARLAIGGADVGSLVDLLDPTELNTIAATPSRLAEFGLETVGKLRDEAIEISADLLRNRLERNNGDVTAALEELRDELLTELEIRLDAEPERIGQLANIITLAIAASQVDTAAPAPTTASTIEVAPDDSLWRIAARLLGEHATIEETTAAWHLLFSVNTDTIGANPDLIFPGTRLIVPEELQSP
jgi:hypothetical protein